MDEKKPDDEVIVHVGGKVFVTREQSVWKDVSSFVLILGPLLILIIATMIINANPVIVCDISNLK